MFPYDSSRHRSTCCVQISWNSADGKSVKSWVTYWHTHKQNFAQLSRLRYCSDQAQICQGQPPRMQSLHGDLNKIGSRLAELYPNACMNTIKTSHKLFSVFGWSLSSSRIIICSSRKVKINSKVQVMFLNITVTLNRCHNLEMFHITPYPVIRYQCLCYWWRSRKTTGTLTD